MHWIPVTKPPRTTREVVVVTNYNDVFILTYTKTADDGIWQTPDRFNSGEKVEWWTDKPDSKSARSVEQIA